MVITEYDITTAMTIYGGSFIMALADAWRAADERNRARIEDAFAAEFSAYRSMAAFSRGRVGLLLSDHAEST